MARIDCTMIFVDAPGLRPTAIDAPWPINPTPIAAPRAARPTEYSRSSCLSFLAVQRGHCTTDASASAVRGRGPVFFVLADEQREDGRQQHEHHRLHQTHQQLHEIERHRQQPAEPGTIVAIVSSMFSPAKTLP